MRVAFYSNFLNHHQLPFCQAMVELTDNNFTFVATEPIPSERLTMGYHSMNDKYPFVLKTYEDDESKKKALELANESDVVVIGSAPSEFVHERILSGKLTFHYSERIYKQGYFSVIHPGKLRGHSFLWPNFLQNKDGWLWKTHGRYRDCDNLYLLCASAYTAGDMMLSGLYRKKAFKWGYFPEVKEYNIIEQLKNRTKPIQLLWVGRMIDWKHPETCLMVAEKLKEDGYKFQFSIVGNGDLYMPLQKMIIENSLSEYVHLLGFMSPERVRASMEQADIYLFTSDYNEGWGAVLNEAMSSGCAVVSSDAIGSSRFLINNGTNGLLYKYGNDDELYHNVKLLMDDEEKRRMLAQNAYQTLQTEWNANVAAERLLQLSKKLMNRERTPFRSGPCSVAKPIIRGKLIE